MANCEELVEVDSNMQGLRDLLDNYIQKSVLNMIDKPTQGNDLISVEELVMTAESRSAPGLLIDTDGDTRTTLIRCQVFFHNSTRIRLFHRSVKLDSEVGSVAMSDETEEDTIVSVNASSGSANFTGGFGILEINHNLVQLNLTPNSNKSIITVINGTDVGVQWQGEDRLLITPMQRVNHSIASWAEYEVKVRTVEGLKDKVIISLAANDQSVEIDVNYDPETSAIGSILGVSMVLLIDLCIIFLPCCPGMCDRSRPFPGHKGNKQPRSSVLPTVPTVTPQSQATSHKLLELDDNTPC
ncbi:hypothetical protein POM88_024437 [Heracleum sosnowskyi]|uniref:Nuclear pore complex protein GP210 C-terminal Ig-like domain-containing protein n=1 Tax=Heracleum sosnowskyi TaxID=360622 RepID=A0AAD8I2V5_9APIA|nr:hypothetical protein POM88_024437 [Heracleum sosnowskyi]